MRSPERSPEMLDGLRETLADGKYSATVAYAHLFMESGARDAMNAYDALARSRPTAEAMRADRDLSPLADLQHEYALA